MTCHIGHSGMVSLLCVFSCVWLSKLGHCMTCRIVHTCRDPFLFVSFNCVSDHKIALDKWCTILLVLARFHCQVSWTPSVVYPSVCRLNPTFYTHFPLMPTRESIQVLFIKYHLNKPCNDKKVRTDFRRQNSRLFPVFLVLCPNFPQPKLYR